jgi:hypothetical protein
MFSSLFIVRQPGKTEKGTYLLVFLLSVNSIVIARRGKVDENTPASDKPELKIDD